MDYLVNNTVGLEVFKVFFGIFPFLQRFAYVSAMPVAFAAALYFSVKNKATHDGAGIPRGVTNLSPANGLRFHAIDVEMNFCLIGIFPEKVTHVDTLADIDIKR